jgi:hypothetical protein
VVPHHNILGIHISLRLGILADEQPEGDEPLPANANVDVKLLWMTELTLVAIGSYNDNNKRNMAWKWFTHVCPLAHPTMDPDAKIWYHASDMILHIHSDASYLSVSNARNLLGGLLFCGDKPPNEENINGSILNVAAIIKNVVVSAAGSEEVP